MIQFRDKLYHWVVNKWSDTIYECHLTNEGYYIKQDYYSEKHQWEVSYYVNLEKGNIKRTTSIYKGNITRYRYGDADIDIEYFTHCRDRIKDFLCMEVTGEANKMFSDRLDMLMKWDIKNETKNMDIERLTSDMQFEKRIWELKPNAVCKM